jgi:rhomboid family GlyGly-CTERM serine protease
MSARRPIPILIPALAGIVLLLAAWPGSAALLEYRPDAVASGQIWRLLTWHAAHWSGRHLIWDLLAFLVLGSLAELRSRRLVAQGLVAGTVIVSATVFLVHPDLAACRGLSGLDCTLFAVLWWQILQAARTEKDRVRATVVVVAGVGFVAKTLYEFAFGQAFFAGDGFVPLPVSHLAGLAAGLLVAVGNRHFPVVSSWHNRGGMAMIR